MKTAQEMAFLHKFVVLPAVVISAVRLIINAVKPKMYYTVTRDCYTGLDYDVLLVGSLVAFKVAEYAKKSEVVTKILMYSVMVQAIMAVFRFFMSGFRSVFKKKSPEVVGAEAGIIAAVQEKESAAKAGIKAGEASVEHVAEKAAAVAASDAGMSEYDIVKAAVAGKEAAKTVSSAI